MIKSGIDLSQTRFLPDRDLGGRLVPHKFVGVSGYLSIWRSLETASDTLGEPIWGPGEAEASGIGAG
jgi:hypothetical protein